MGVEIVTIVNQSGKIISNGKQLFSVFKEAKAAYDDKKASLKAQRAPPPPSQEPYEVAPVPEYDPQFDPQYDPEVEYGRHTWQHQSLADDDTASRATSRRSHRSKASRATRRTALTAGNLKTLSEVSSVAPSRKPPTAVYRSPYAETAPRDMTLSRPTIMPDQRTSYDAPLHYDDPALPRSHSAPTMLQVKEPDMDLAYGNVPPDLADRHDLDPVYQALKKEEQAQTLMKRVETILTEANCMHHTATHMIKHLQEKPEAAAACALTLAELSAILGKMSPAFLGLMKGGSPAVFALLASPQFLIAAAGLTVGVTVVMFGGLKIIKRMKEKQALEAAATRQPIEYAPHPDEGYEDPYMMHGPYVQQYQEPYPEDEEGASQGGYDEAVVLEEELSGIESWRRGIVPFGADESADLELISPEAERALRGDDAQTVRSGRTARTNRTSKTAKTAKTEKTERTEKTHRSSHHHSHHHHHSSSSSSHKARSKSLESDARSVRSDVRDEGGNDAASEAGSHRSHKSHKSHKSHRSERSERSVKSHRSTRTTQSKREAKAIEDGSKDKENTIEAVLRPKKDTMLKSLFKKKKEQDDKQKEMATSRSSVRMA